MGSDADSRLIALTDDGFVLPVVGPWAKRKYHYLGRYLNAFTTAMRMKWGELHYLDLFSGAGLARIEGSGEIVPTSTLLAASVEHPFTRVVACDRDAANIEALRARLNRLPNQATATAAFIAGDANDRIDDIIRDVPRRSALSVTFADPFGLHLDFETVRRVAEIRSDLIVLLADNMDALRNWATYYLTNPRSTLDRFMGEPGWRDLLAQTPSDRQAEALRTRYQERLAELGYQEFAYERIVNTSGRGIYILLFATRNAAGLKIWKGISKIDEGGQRRLFG